LYFVIPLDKNNKSWAPNCVCKSCVEYLRLWNRGKRSTFKFGISAIWRVPKNHLRGDQEGLFKLVTLDRILNHITGVTSGYWWLVVVNAIPISDICQINQQNISSCSVINNRIKNFSQLYCQLKQSFLITR
jgi:hypothetical protein